MRRSGKGRSALINRTRAGRELRVERRGLPGAGSFDAATCLRRTAAGPGPGAAELAALQGTGGNAAVARLLRSRSTASTPAAVQAKLMVGAADDPLERAADRVADEVMRNWLSRTGTVSQDEADAGRLRRVVDTGPEASAGFEADPGVAGRLSARRGTGHRLPTAVLSRMEAGFDADFGAVRVHRDAEAAALSTSLSARAFTHGSDIYFGPNAYDPASHAGQRLLAHELAHVVQQGGAGRVFRQHVSPGAPSTPAIRRMSLEQTKWERGVEDIGERQLVSDGRTVHVYHQQVAAEAGDKTKALQAAGASNAALGKLLDNKAVAEWRVRDSNDKWTRRDQALDQADLEWLDPFFYAVTVPFKVADQKHQLELLFQHASNWTGYVEAIYDSTNPATGAVPTMYDIGAAKPLKGVDSGHWRNPEYSNVHEAHGTDPLIDATGGGGEASFDAYTKIAGEGARWQCVRQHASHLSNDSYFFITERGRNYGVTFKTLWLSWKSAFGKAYDIDDAEVAAAIWTRPRTFSGEGVKSYDPIPGKDYDLDNHRAYVAPPRRR